MKKTFTALLISSVLISLTAAAAGGMKAIELSDILNKDVKVAQDAQIKSLKAEGLSDAMGKISRGGAADKATLAIVLQTNEGDLAVADVARALVSSHTTLNDSIKVSNDLSPEAIALKKAVESGNEAYAQGLGVIASRISDNKTDAGKAVAKVLMMGKEVAAGNLSVAESGSYETLVRGMTSLLKTGQAKTAEEALQATLKSLGFDVAAKIQELLGCKA